MVERRSFFWPCVVGAAKIVVPFSSIGRSNCDCMLQRAWLLCEFVFHQCTCWGPYSSKCPSFFVTLNAQSSHGEGLATSDFCESVARLALDKSGGFVGKGGEYEAFVSIKMAELFGQYVIDDSGFSAPTSAIEKQSKPSSLGR